MHGARPARSMCLTPVAVVGVRVQPTYERVVKYLDLSNRIDVLNSRLDIIRELLDILSQQLENQHGVCLSVAVAVAVGCFCGLFLWAVSVCCGARRSPAACLSQRPSWRSSSFGSLSLKSLSKCCGTCLLKIFSTWYRTADAAMQHQINGGHTLVVCRCRCRRSSAAAAHRRVPGVAAVTRSRAHSRRCDL